MGDYDRKSFMQQFCNGVSRAMSQYDPDLSMTYAFIGITDSKLIDFHRDRNINMDKISRGLDGLQHEVEDWELTEEKIMKGATLPFILSLHFESLRNNSPTNGNLCLIDLNVVHWSTSLSSPAPESIASPQLSSHGCLLQQSTDSLANLVHMLANPGIITGVTIPNNPLLSLVSEFLYGESKTSFVFYLNTEDSATTDLQSTISLIKSLRCLKSHECIKHVDRRVNFFFEKAKYYQSEKYRLQDELETTQEEKEQTEKDLDDVQQDFGQERDALSKEIDHWQKKSKTLEDTLANLKSESAGMEADAKWENARLVTEKLALKDELRRAEIEMTAAEDAKTGLLDLYENLEESYNSLDSVYCELLSAYRMLKDRFGQLTEDNDLLKQRIEELETQAEIRQAHVTKLKEDIATATRCHQLTVDELDSEHAQTMESLEVQLRAASQKLKQQQTRVSQLESENRALSASQTEAVSSLQTTIGDLTSQLEDAQDKASHESSDMAAKLRTAQRQIKRLETERARLPTQADSMSMDSDSYTDFADREAGWKREREQLQRQIKRLEQTAKNAERREAELREESERQWSAWETEKNRSHDKYLKLKGRFREAVEFAADVQTKLDSEREDNGHHMTEDKAEDKVPVKTEDKPAAPTVVKPKPKPRAKAKTKKSTTSTTEEDSESAIAQQAVTEPAATSTRRTNGRRKTRADLSYTEPVDGDDTFSEFRKDNQPAAKDISGSDDDSEISFNPAALEDPKAPATKKKQQRGGGRPLKVRKSAQELNAELTTKPARKRKIAAAQRKQQNTEDKVAAMSLTDKPVKKAASPPKRKLPSSLSTAASSSNGNGNGTTTGLKKKRKLNLDRMRTLVGTTGGLTGAKSKGLSTANSSNPLVVKFAVPKIRIGIAEADTAEDSDCG